jgi:hypothetical protein
MNAFDSRMMMCMSMGMCMPSPVLPPRSPL